MKCVILSLILFISHIYLFCQNQKNSQPKPSIDLSVLGKWPFVSNAAISNDGQYAQYTVDDPTTGIVNNYICSLESSWLLCTGYYHGQFTNDSKIAIIKINNDSLQIVKLSDKTVNYITNVSSFKLSNDGKWLVYMETLSKKLVLIDLQDLQSKNVFYLADNFLFDNLGNFLLIQTSDETKKRYIQLFNLHDKKLSTIYELSGEESTSDYLFSKDKNQLAFTVHVKSSKNIFYYEDGLTKATLLFSENFLIGKHLSIEKISDFGFTMDGQKLFLNLIEDNIDSSLNEKESVDVWSYTDNRLQLQQLKMLQPRRLKSVVDIKSQKIVMLEEEDEIITSYNSDFAVVARTKGNAIYDEWYWNKSAQSSVYLVSIRDGSRKILGANISASIAYSYRLSPDGKYVIYYDPHGCDYMSYELVSGIFRNITKGLNGRWTRYDKRDVLIGLFMPISPGGVSWVKGDSYVILYDQCDIYQVDPSGKRPSINLTSGFGRKFNIEFRLVQENKIFNGIEELAVTSFNRVTKNDGFFRIQLGQNKVPKTLTTEPCMFKGTWEDDRFSTFHPIKAKDADVFIVRHMTARESPNYLWTRDFRTFNKLTDVHPERNYNWLTTELITWKTFDGSFSQGILYKPENFDNKRKYPIIFYYYERLTEGLHGFLNPDYSHGVLNIPYYVSNGYLVFAADIRYKIGHPGKSVTNTIVSAAKYLAKLPYVDAKHMGIQGHSRGGWETNFIITHTNIFTAAVSSSGFVNYVSLYNAIRSLPAGISRQPAYEVSYQRIGATLWERPDLFIENSPIFQAHKVTTPLLMMNNKDDHDVPFEQGIEFFSALRRLGKKVWLLQYDDQKHMVFDKASVDFTIRMKQFFDHYLKESPAPEWMIRGVPAKQRGYNKGLNLEESGIKPGQGLTLPKEITNKILSSILKSKSH